MFKSTIGQMFNFTSGLKNPASWLTQYFGSTKSSSGIVITPQVALGIPEVYNAVAKISGHISGMEMDCWIKDKDGGTDVKDMSDPGARVWNNPNPVNTSQSLVEKLMVDALLLGNGRFYIERNGKGEVVNLWPIQAEDAQTVMVSGERWHCITINTGTEVGDMKTDAESPSGTMYKLRDEDVFYVMGLTRNGWWGENLLYLAKDVLGLSVAAAESAGTLCANSGRPGLVLEAPQGHLTDPKDAKEFLKSFQDAYTGLDNVGKTALIRNGMSVHSMSWQSMDSSYIDNRQFQRECAALLFLLESVIGDQTGNVYKSITERQSVYLTNCLQRWTTKIEQEANKKLLSGRKLTMGNRRYKLDIRSLFENDRDGLALYTSSLRQQGIITTNEARKIHGMKPLENTEDGTNYDEDAHLMLTGGSGGSEEDNTQEEDPTDEKSADTTKDVAGDPQPKEKDKE